MTMLECIFNEVALRMREHKLGRRLQTRLDPRFNIIEVHEFWVDVRKRAIIWLYFNFDGNLAINDYANKVDKTYDICNPNVDFLTDIENTMLKYFKEAVRIDNNEKARARRRAKKNE